MWKAHVSFAGDAPIGVAERSRIRINRPDFLEPGNNPLREHDSLSPKMGIQLVRKHFEIVPVNWPDNLLHHQFQPVTIKGEDRITKL